MSITINNTSAYEREIDENWAAAYAKRLTDQEVINRNSAITTAVGAEATARAAAVSAEADARAAAVGAEEAARVSRDNALADGTALEDECIKSRHITPGSVTTVKLDTGAVTGDKIADGTITAFKIADGAVHTSKLHNGAVSLDKLASDLKTYSTTPKQVGTWVDGTPVWRVAFSGLLKSYGYVDGDKAFGVLQNYVTDLYHALIINGFAGVYNGSVDAGYTASCCTTNTSGGFELYSPQLVNDTMYGAGWIEFTCDEKYLIEGSEQT